MSASEQAARVCFPPSFLAQYGSRIGADGIGVVYVLLERADSHGISRVGYRYFERNLRIGHATLQRTLFSLESCGLISVEREREPGRNARNRYILHAPLYEANITRLETRRGRAAAAR